MANENYSAANRGTRKAYASRGDDATLTRFIKIDPGFHAKKLRKLQPRLPGIGVPAFVAQGRTKFTSRVLPVDKMSNLLTSGHSNVKIGRDIRTGHYSGYYIYYLSLEERKTCPSTCKLWQNCYGNNMPFAKRVKYDDPAFLPRLEAEIDQLCQKRYGVMIRLHALGDFYSSQYVLFWRRMMDRHPNLAIFGYTAHDRTGTIGRALASMNEDFGRRCMVRNSNGTEPDMCTVTIAAPDSPKGRAFICPEMTGKRQCCATCAACWSTKVNVAFMEH